MSYFDDEKDNQPGDEEEMDDAEDGQDEGSDEEGDEPDDEDSGLDDEDESEESEGDEDDESSDDDDASDEESDEDEDSDDDSEGEDDKGSSAIIQKKKWRKRALQAERKLQDLQKGKKGKTAPAKKPSSVSALQERNDFRMDHPNLKTREVDEIEAFAKTKGISLRAAYKSDIVQAMIKRNAQKRKAADSSFDPSRRSQPTKKAKDWSRAGRDEMEAEAARRVAAAEAARR